MLAMHVLIKHEAVPEAGKFAGIEVLLLVYTMYNYIHYMFLPQMNRHINL